jgi:hypothetical protein
MRRRQFIAAIGGAAAWPLAARAQQGVRRVGVLTAAAEATAILPRGLREELPKLGWIEGRNLRLDVRGGDYKTDRYRTFAAELVNLRPDVIVTAGTPATTAVQQLTQTIPIVFLVVGDPLVTGLVKSVARPEVILPGSVVRFFLSVKSGYNYSKRPRPASKGSRPFTIPNSSLRWAVTGPRSRRLRVRWPFRQSPFHTAMLLISSVRSTRLRLCRTVA